MRKVFSKSFAVSFSLLVAHLLYLSSCTGSEESLLNQPEQFQGKNRNDDLIANNALYFYKSMYGSALRSNSSELEVDSVIHSLPSSLRASSSDSLGVCVVNFKNNNGFVVMNEVRNYSPIAVVERGSFDINHLLPTRQDSAMYFLINNAISEEMLTKKFESTHDREKIEGRDFHIIELIEHKTRTRWGQDRPYFINHDSCPAGCVAVAIGQAFTYYKTIKHPIHHGILVDWDAIEKECSKNNGHLYRSSNESVRVQVNEVLWWIGQSNKAKYKKDGTSMNSSRVLKFAQKNGFETYPDMYEFTAQQVRSGLLENKLTYMDGSGESRYFLFNSWSWTVGGHAWLVDGYALVQSKNFPHHKYELVHVNWGWDGQLDGYFYSGVFDASHEPVVPSGSLRSNNEYNFKFGVKMTHIYPKSYDKQ